MMNQGITRIEELLTNLHTKNIWKTQDIIYTLADKFKQRYGDTFQLSRPYHTLIGSTPKENTPPVDTHRPFCEEVIAELERAQQEMEKES